MASPRPSPPWRRVMVESAWRKRSKTKGRKSAGDALAGVADPDLGVTVGPGQADLHAPARGGELDGVREQVPHHLLQPARVAGELAARPGRARRSASMPFASAPSRTESVARVDHRGQVDRGRR